MLVTLESRAKWWEVCQSIEGYTDDNGAGPSTAHLEGASAYAHSQAAIQRRLRNRFAGMWEEVGLPREVVGNPEEHGMDVEEPVPSEEMDNEAEEQLAQEVEGEVEEQVHVEEDDGLFR